MRDVFVAGIKTTHFSRDMATPLERVAAEAVIGAIRDADIDHRRVQEIYVSHMSQGEVAGQRVLRELGFPEIPVTNVENACAGGGAALRQAWMAVGSGMVDIALVLGMEKLAAPGLLSIAVPSYEDHIGQILPGSYALAGARHMAEHGSTERDLAWIASKNRTNGVKNVRATFQKASSVDEVLASRPIAGSLTLLQCCSPATGAAAVILVGGDAAKTIGHRMPRILACGLSSKIQWGQPEDLTIYHPTYRAAKAAYDYAGVSPEDIDVIELHDAFSIGELLHYEGLMLCKRGEAASLVRQQATALGGRIPVNPSGGLLARGHPVGATGVVQIVELVEQLRGTSPHNQVQGARVALAQAQGGTGAGAGAATVSILSN